MRSRQNDNITRTQFQNNERLNQENVIKVSTYSTSTSCQTINWFQAPGIPLISPWVSRNIGTRWGHRKWHHKLDQMVRNYINSHHNVLHHIVSSFLRKISEASLTVSVYIQFTSNKYRKMTRLHLGKELWGNKRHKGHHTGSARHIGSRYIRQSRRDLLVPSL